MGARTLVQPPEPVWYQQQYQNWLLSQQRIDLAMNSAETNRSGMIDGECVEVTEQPAIEYDGGDDVR